MSKNPPTVPPDLAAVLATLSQFAPQAAQPQASPLQQGQGQYPGSGKQLHHPFDSAPPLPQSRTLPPEKAVIDPASITEWSAGLRCVSKIAAQNREFSESIRRMINDQRRHEMQWYAGRQALKKDQGSRGSKVDQIQNILKAVGGTGPAEEHKPQTEAEKQAELSAYDRKIHAAQVDMGRAMSQELKALGVPFFGTSPSLVSTSPESDDNTARPKWSPRITSEQLIALKRRMIGHLEDMYKD